MEENKYTLPDNVTLSTDFNSLSDKEKQILISFIQKHVNEENK